jgi:phosphoribosylformylglycinamidine synthase I
MMKPRVLVLRAAGTNCDVETAYAFDAVGAASTTLHINRLRERPLLLREMQILAIPGGFSYGDDIASGRIFANELVAALRDELTAFVDRGGFVIGICNGFQVLVKSGLLPALPAKAGSGAAARQQATLTDNSSGRYSDRWVRVTGDPVRCKWIADADEIELPVAHGEGRFVADAPVLEALSASHQIALRYSSGTNPNGAAMDIAGVCDPSGRVFGLMPHPERFLRFENHPRWTREARRAEGDGVRFFRTAVAQFGSTAAGRRSAATPRRARPGVTAPRVSAKAAATSPARTASRSLET